MTSAKMASYELKIKREAEKEIHGLPKNDLQRIAEKINRLASEPRPNGCEKLKGEEGYRIRQGDYRIVYLVNDEVKTVTVIRVGHRREVYR